MLSPISNPLRLASKNSGIFETKVLISTSCLTMFNTPPCFKPSHSFSFTNLTGTKSATVVFSPTLRKSI